MSELSDEESQYIREWGALELTDDQVAIMRRNRQELLG